MQISELNQPAFVQSLLKLVSNDAITFHQMFCAHFWAGCFCDIFTENSSMLHQRFLVCVVEVFSLQPGPIGQASARNGLCWPSWISSPIGSACAVWISIGKQNSARVLESSREQSKGDNNFSSCRSSLAFQPLISSASVSAHRWSAAIGMLWLAPKLLPSRWIGCGNQLTFLSGERHGWVVVALVLICLNAVCHGWSGPARLLNC